AEHGVEVFARSHLLGALEHHVLEEMRKAGAALALVTGTDVVDDGDGEDRGDVILGHDEAQAVRELRVGKLDRRRRDRGEGSAEREYAGDAGCEATRETAYHRKPPEGRMA